MRRTSHSCSFVQALLSVNADLPRFRKYAFVGPRGNGKQNSRPTVEQFAFILLQASELAIARIRWQTKSTILKGSESCFTVYVIHNLLYDSSFRLPRVLKVSDVAQVHILCSLFILRVSIYPVSIPSGSTAIWTARKCFRGSDDCASFRYRFLSVRF
jgi:hypothetical protein